MIATLSKLALGTAQFGLPYGISNRLGQVSEGEIESILLECRKRGIDTLDTASAYGQSETVLGSFLASSEWNRSFKVVSKLPPVPSRPVKDELEYSLQRLGVRNLDGYLFHHFGTWFEHRGLWEEMLSVKAMGHVRAVGFSLYHPEELETLWDSGVEPDLIQVPFSLLDQRFLPLLKECSRRGTRVHVRSVFLQGLVFLDPESIHPHFRPAVEVLRHIREVALRLDVAISHLCLAFPLLNPNVERVVIGVESVENLRDNCQVEGVLGRIPKEGLNWSEMGLDDLEVLLPMNWPARH